MVVGTYWAGKPPTSSPSLEARKHAIPDKTACRRRRVSDGSENSCVRRRAKHKDHVWSYDFLTDRTEEGRQLRRLTVIDETTRECLAIEVARLFTA